MNERDWSRDRQRFVSDADQARRRDQQPRRDHGFPLGPLGREFAALTYALLDADTVEDVLEQVVTATAKVTAGADVVSVTLRSPDGSFFTPVFTHSIARDVDELQYSFGEGPCMTAAEDPGPAFTSWRDLRADAPWPRFAPAACEAGIHAVLSVASACSHTASAFWGVERVFTFHWWPRHGRQRHHFVAGHPCLPGVGDHRGGDHLEAA